MSKRIKIVVAFLMLLIFISSSAYFSRGWIRGTAIPNYATRFYKPPVDKNFSKVFFTVNSRLGALGLSFASPTQDQCFSRGDVMYEGFSETVPCIKQQESKPIVLDSDFIYRWQSESPEFEKYLISSGWQKQFNAHESIKLFSDPGYGVSVNYSKTHGKLFCNLSIGYSSDQENPNKIFVDETCERDVSFFGGSSG